MKARLQGAREARRLNLNIQVTVFVQRRDAEWNDKSTLRYGYIFIETIKIIFDVENNFVRAEFVCRVYFDENMLTVDTYGTVFDVDAVGAAMNSPDVVGKMLGRLLVKRIGNS